MEAKLCLRGQHLPAIRHHRNAVMHSSVRLPVLQAQAGPPPGASRVVVVGAGVVLACTLGAMYWKRGVAMAMFPHGSPTCRAGGGGNGPDLSSRDATINNDDLYHLLLEICVKHSKPARLNKLIGKRLKDEVRELEKKLPTERGQHEYNWGLVLVLALIKEKDYDKAKKICDKLKEILPSDSKPDHLKTIIDMMMKKESPKRVEKELKDYYDQNKEPTVADW